MKPGQKEAFDTIHRAVTQRSVYSEDERRQRDAKVFFLQGHAGTRKTYLLSLLRDRVEKDGYLVRMTATTGIAASLYEGGSTLHSLLGIGVDENKDASTRTERPRLSKYGPRNQIARLLRKMMLLIVDEASMMARILFEVMDAILKDLRESRTYFSGLIIFLLETTCNSSLGEVYMSTRCKIEYISIMQLRVAVSTLIIEMYSIIHRCCCKWVP